MMPGKELPAAKGVATKYTKRHEGFATNKECLWHRGHGWSTDCTDQHGLNRIYYKYHHPLLTTHHSPPRLTSSSTIFFMISFGI